MAECKGNENLARLRYEFKEAERQSMLHDIELQKTQIMGGTSLMSTFGGTSKNPMYTTLSPLNNLKALNGSSSSKMLGRSMRCNNNMYGSTSKDDVDRKIFQNMIKQQVEQEKKLAKIQERQEKFIQKSELLKQQREQQLKRKRDSQLEKQQQKQQKLLQ